MDPEIDDITIKSDKNDQIKEKSITLQLIIERNLAKSLKTDIYEDNKTNSSLDLTTSSLLNLTHIRLDRENINEIDNLAEFLNHSKVTHLFLQHNLIRRIENLEFLTNLIYLNLSSNKITEIENLRHLKRLQLVDLSSNQIDGRVEDIVNQLPPNLAFLDLRDNPIFKGADHDHNFDLISSKLPTLVQLNGLDMFEEHTRGSKEGAGNEDETISRLKDDILERSRARRQNDRVLLDRDWEQKRLALESIRASMNEKFSTK